MSDDEQTNDPEIELLGLIIPEIKRLPLDAQRRVADYVNRLVSDNERAARSS